MRSLLPPLWLLLGLWLLAQYCAQVEGRDVVSRRCHQCGGEPGGIGEARITPCGSPDGSVKATLCPTEQPYCATVASSPNFTSLVTCAAEIERSCSLIRSNNKYTMTCVCTTHLCNAPFSAKLRQELIEFSRSHVPIDNTSADYIDGLWNISHYGNTVDDSGSIYKLITVPIKETIFFPKTTTMTTKAVWMNLTSAVAMTTLPAEMPHAEALRNEATVPSSDDEDDVEGSGSYEDGLTSNSPSAPAAPSSYLPADENDAANLALDLATLASLLLYAIQ